MIGYVIQPRKNIPSWWLFYGRGSNGKTVILDIIMSLLKNNVLSQSIGDFDTARNSHAFASLSGKLLLVDDDVRSKTILPDDFLKKVSENKLLTANPKFRPTYQFQNAVTPLLAANALPIMRDLSHGMQRRAMVIPFRRQFHPDEMDLNRSKRIIESELSGILNNAIKGLIRLRKRGNFKPPQSCIIAKQVWLESSNTVFAFIADNLIIHKKLPRRFKPKHIKNKTPFNIIYHNYEQWCYENDIEAKHTYSKRGLMKALHETGLDKYNNNGERGFLHVTIKTPPNPNNNDDEYDFS